MTMTNIIEHLDRLITKGGAISDIKPHFVDAADRAAAFDKTLADSLERIASLQISLETERTRNSALVARMAEQEQAHTKAMEDLQASQADAKNEPAPPATYRVRNRFNP